MKKWYFIGVAVASAVLVILVVWFGQPVLAHEGREVDEYEIRFGWQVEPAYAGVYNGPEVFIQSAWRNRSRRKTGDRGREDTALEGDIWQAVERIDTKARLANPGHYVAQLTPTRPGDYQLSTDRDTQWHW